MSKLFSGIFAVVLLQGLVACGGSGPVTTPPDPAPQTTAFAERVSDFNALSSGIPYLEGNADELATTPEAQLPTGGAATFEGVLALVLNPQSTTLDSIDSVGDSDALGTINLTATFASTGNSIRGSASDFVDSESLPIVGALTLTQGAISANATGNAFSGEVTGALTDSEGVTYTVTGGGYLGGLANGVDAAVGLLGGDIVGAPGVDDFLGVFVARPR